MKRSKILTFAASGLICSAAWAADLKTPFQSLPAETIAAVRFDNRPEVVAKYVETTKLGKLLFSDEKIEQYKEFIQTLIDSDEEAAAFVEKLGSVGLSMDDIYAMFNSEFGAAVVNQEVDGFAPMPTILVWADLDPEISERVYGAILKATGENETLERVDQDLAGVTASRIRNKEKGDSFLIAQLENRFLFAIGLPVDVQITSQEEAVKFEDAEWDALGYFIQCQKGSGGEFLNAFYGDAGVNAVRPDYDTRIEALGDIGKALQYVPAKSAPIVQGLQLDQFTKVAVWSGLVNMEERSTVFLGVPAPRSGFASLIENESFSFQPPAWVPANVNTFSTFSFDLSRLYEIAVEVAKQMTDPVMVDQNIANMNAQLQGTLQTDIATLIGSFGTRFNMLEYPIEVSTVELMGTSAEMPRAPQAIVVDFSRPEILQAALGLISGMASGPDSQIKIIDEQGFKGIRAPSPQGEVTFAFGSGKLLLLVGSETLASRVFSALNNPPSGEDALVNDPNLRDFLDRHNPKQGIGFSYAYGDRMISNLVPVFRMLGETLRSKAGEDQAVVDAMTELFPTEEELKGMLGVVFSRAYVNEHGVVIEGVNEYK